MQLILHITAYYYAFLHWTHQYCSMMVVCCWLYKKVIIHISRDQPKAKEFTKYMGQASPLPGAESVLARSWSKWWAPLRIPARYLCGMVPMSPVRTTDSLPMTAFQGPMRSADSRPLPFQAASRRSDGTPTREPHEVIQDSVNPGIHYCQ